MELPYNGRATITQEFDRIIVSIPVKKNYFIIAFLCFWMFGWVMGESFAIGTLISEGISGVGLFLIVWLAGWTLGGFFVIRTLWRFFTGKEVIEVQKGTLTIKKSGVWFSKPKIFDLAESKNFRTVDNVISQLFPLGVQPFAMFKNNTGVIAFDYGMQTIKFADGIHEAEGKHILRLFKEKRFLSDDNF